MVKYLKYYKFIQVPTSESLSKWRNKCSPIEGWIIQEATRFQQTLYLMNESSTPYRWASERLQGNMEPTTIHELRKKNIHI